MLTAKGNGGFSDVSDRPSEKSKKFIDKLPKNEKARIVSAIEQLPKGNDIIASNLGRKCPKYEVK